MVLSYLHLRICSQSKKQGTSAPPYEDPACIYIDPRIPVNLHLILSVKPIGIVTVTLTLSGRNAPVAILCEGMPTEMNLPTIPNPNQVPPSAQ